ncbi:hypothetical protein ACH6EH_06760 [Paenibacillus sp. JSM ZJ436]|uniref:hypothetical protein n=1 Tax=Paenibacillus sp. JSM ZJ436 TaxID=3376190 RepID=UPI0037BD5266
MNMLSGNTIRRISKQGGIVAGDKKYYELFLYGSTLTIKQEEEVKAIDKAIREAKSNDYNVIEYVQYMIEHEDI